MQTDAEERQQLLDELSELTSTNKRLEQELAQYAGETSLPSCVSNPSTSSSRQLLGFRTHGRGTGFCVWGTLVGDRPCLPARSPASFRMRIHPADADPEALDRLCSAADVAKAAANRWMDNIWAFGESRVLQALPGVFARSMHAVGWCPAESWIKKQMVGREAEIREYFANAGVTDALDYIT